MKNHVQTGRVIAVREKTAVVLVERYVMHPKYKKKYIVSKKYHVHDENSVAKVADTVYFIPCAPKSALKRHVLN